MKTNSKIVNFSATVLLAGLLGGCASGASDSGAKGMSGMGKGSHGEMDMQSMCEMHKKMMSGKTPAEQQAMMQERMKSMSPEMRARMQAMHEKC